MQEKIIIEVGSTVTKIDKYQKGILTRIKSIPIWFKKNYLEKNKLKESDIEVLINEVNNIKKENSNLYICGTSIFRDLNEEERLNFLDLFKTKTGYEFHIITSEEENILTVKGATRFTKGKVCVCIPGGGSTEISIYDNDILDSANSKIGVVDIMEKFPDLSDDIASSSVEEVKEYIKEKLSFPKIKSDILILAGGEHAYFAYTSGIKYEKNTIYEDSSSPIMMDIETRIKETEKYFKAISLDEIRSRVDNPKWWFATRAMCALILAVAEKIEAKYIIPTDIGMAYGLLNDEK